MIVETLELRGVPRYVKISEKLRREIAGGVLRPGDRLPSFSQSRAELGISQATWEKIHSTLELEGLIVREPGRGVFVAEAQSIERKRNNCIGLVGYGFREAGNSTYYATILAGIQEAAQRAGQSVVLLPVEDKASWLQTDGVIMFSWSVAGPVEPESVAVPIVYLLPDAPRQFGVRADESAAMEQLTNYLLSLGHRKIAYLHGCGGVPDSSTRMTGYLSALRQAGVRGSKSWRRGLSGSPRYGAEYIHSGQIAMSHWLQNGWARTGCTAVLVHNDEAAVGAMEAFREAGVLVPRDVSVAGFDGLDVGAYYSPRLTTVEVPLREIGERATDLILQCIQGANAELSPLGSRDVVVPCVLRARDSCALVGARVEKKPNCGKSAA